MSSAIDNLAGLPSLGRDLDFVCYDLVNSATVRAFQTSDRTIMVLYQGTDHELATTRDQMQAITRKACDATTKTMNHSRMTMKIEGG